MLLKNWLRLLDKGKKTRPILYWHLQPVLNCSKPTTEKPEHGVKSVNNQINNEDTRTTSKSAIETRQIDNLSQISKLPLDRNLFSQSQQWKHQNNV